MLAARGIDTTAAPSMALDFAIVDQLGHGPLHTVIALTIEDDAQRGQPREQRLGAQTKPMRSPERGALTACRCRPRPAPIGAGQRQHRPPW